MTAQQILVIDEGTTSTRAMLFGSDGKLLGSQQEDLQQYYPAAGLVEHDANEIWEKTLRCCSKMVEQAGGADKIAAIGITNQRETIVAWDKRTGEPLCKAIVWQDRRTADMCEEMKADGLEEMVQAKTGLLLDPYFSGSKIRWMMDNWPEVRAAGDNLAFGTIESYLIFRLSGGHHITDASNASRTMLMALDGEDWDAELLALFDIPVSTLPRIVDCAGKLAVTASDIFGSSIPICGSAGDQQAATVGQGLFGGRSNQGYFWDRCLHPHQQRPNRTGFQKPTPLDGAFSVERRTHIRPRRLGVRGRQFDAMAS